MLGIEKTQALYTGKKIEQLICFQKEAEDPVFRRFPLLDSKPKTKPKR